MSFVLEEEDLTWLTYSYQKREGFQNPACLGFGVIVLSGAASFSSSNVLDQRFF